MPPQEIVSDERWAGTREPTAPLKPGALVVTGGGRGIGAQIALRAARAGTPVALIYRSRPEAASQVVAEIEAGGGRAIAIAADVGSETQVHQAFESIDRVFGSLCGLVNNAVFAGEPARLSELRMEEFDAVFRTNVGGAFLCAREAAKRLSTRNGGAGGAIVSMSSAIAVGTGAPGWVHFAASKGALETMSRGLAKELAPEGVRVNVVRAGVIGTESRLGQNAEFRNRAIASVPMGRMGDPAEVAAAVLWLLSPDASYVSGATLDVGGGL
ncbi:NAD(P)-dependent dehydrogenase, short-chain alcohol dehydrogenase family [Rhizobiales bacterium GAS113]|nr:NAD(P)-dependent dehydrogenase, short-chain alcohol dehydrogenase family [Rhizobiales bacterium GAS113]